MNGDSGNNYSANVEKFFMAVNRSMMGGWTRPEMEAAKAEAESLTGEEREAAERAIDERVERERAQFGADYNADKDA